MTVVVTGASGHVGANLVRTLMDAGRQVRALIHKDRRAINGLSVETRQIDILDKDDLVKAFADAEVVYHLAAIVSISGSIEDQILAVNLQGTRNVLAACQAAGVKRLVYFSSIQAYADFPAKESIDENRQLTALDYPIAYDRSKANAQAEVIKAAHEGLSAVVINPTAIIGPNDFRPGPMGQLLLNLYHNKFIAMIEGGYNWVDVRDVVWGAMKAEELGQSGSAYLLGGNWHSLLDVAKMVEHITGKKAPRFLCPSWLAMAAVPFANIYSKVTKTEALLTRQALKAVAGRRYISHEKAKSELGYNPRPLEQTIKDSFTWFEQSGLLSAWAKKT